MASDKQYRHYRYSTVSLLFYKLLQRVSVEILSAFLGAKTASTLQLHLM